MNYLFDFDIAALFVNFIVLAFYFQKRNIPIFQNRVFLIMIIVDTVMSALDLYTTLISVYNFNISRNLIWFLNVLYYVCTNSIAIIFVTYCFSIADFVHISTRRKIKLTSCLMFVPYAVCLSIIFLSPILSSSYVLAFYLDENNVYHRGDFWFYLLYLINFCYFIVALVILAKNRKRIVVEKIHVVVYYMIFVLAAFIGQMFFATVLFECFAVSLASLLFFFSVQKPEEVLDPVTGLNNETAFVKMVSHQLKTNVGKYTCLSVNLDDSVFLMNSFGLTQVNNFMREVSLFFQSNFKLSQLYYLGQGRFCVMFKNPEYRVMKDAIERIETRFQAPWSIDSVDLRLYSHILVINCPESANTPEEIIDFINIVSDDERYKHLGVMNARDVDLAWKRRTIFIERALRQGVSDNLFEVYYQPIYSKEEKCIIGAEALARLKDENGEFISPDDFIPIAEKTGTILHIGAFVFESVCRTLSEIDIEKYGIKKIHINLSVAQCMQDILSSELLTLKNIYQLNPSIFNLEITETAAISTPDILLSNMQRLSDAGIELSLDDYGSGYSNMNYLLSLPFKMVKIDKRIIWTAFFDERAERALKATIDMIHSLGMKVLAEGCETQEQAVWLMDNMGCDLLQGYCFSKPCPTDKFLELMLEKGPNRKIQN